MKRSISPRRLRMGCGETLFTLIPMAIRRGGVTASAGCPKTSTARRQRGKS